MPHASDIQLTPEQQRLALAVNDMKQAADAARILDRQVSLHARRALETAISVCYARPWLDSNAGGKLKDTWLPKVGPDRELHRRLLKLRHRTYAHTDPAGGRAMFAQRGVENVLAIGETWISLLVSDLSAIVDLCERQAERFTNALTEGLDG